MAVRLPLLELVALAQPGEDPLLGLFLGEARELARLVVHAAVRADHGRLGQPVVAADLEVELVVSRGDLERSGSEADLHPLVGDHGHAPLDPGHDHLATDGVAVALVVRVHGDRDVGRDRRRARGGDRHVAVAVRERVADIGEGVVDLAMLELEIRQRGEMERAPVDDPVRPVDPALLPDMDEEPHHRADVGVVHGEPLAPVVERGADPPELEHDLAAVLVQPLPDELDERLAPEILPRLPLGGEVLLDRALGRDAGVVVPGLEEDVVALHPPRADDRVGE